MCILERPGTSQISEATAAIAVKLCRVLSLYRGFPYTEDPPMKLDADFFSENPIQEGNIHWISLDWSTGTIGPEKPMFDGKIHGFL